MQRLYDKQGRIYPSWQVPKRSWPMLALATACFLAVAVMLAVIFGR